MIQSQIEAYFAAVHDYNRHRDIPLIVAVAVNTKLPALRETLTHPRLIARVDSILCSSLARASS